ncbi:MAG: SBBP repeat-containing protein, partial [Desulfobacterales bacterium]|nr:SBBP repeat-containing protein [Desulfobacterales bacterium]
MNISCDGACDWGDFTYYAPYAVVRTEEYGNFSVVVRVENQSFVDDSMAGIMLYDSDGNSSLFGRFRGGGVNSYRVEEFLDNVASGVVENASVSSLPAWFRVRKVGDVKYFDYSTDGSVFVNLHNTTSIRGDFVGVFVKRFGVENVSVSFSDFKINSLSVKDYSSYGNDGVIETDEVGDSVPIYSSTGGYNGKGAYEFDGVDDSISVDYVNLSGRTVSMRIYNGTGWYHVVNNSALSYVNGVVENMSLPFNGSRIGVYSDGSYFNGTIDEFVVFDRVLSSEQISVLYENRSDLIVSGETNHYENWSVMVTANDGGVDSEGVLSGSLSVLPIVPTISSVVLNSSGGANFTTENLTAYPVNVSPSGSNVSYEWYRNGELFVEEWWNSTFDGDGADDRANGVVVDEGGNSYVTGWVNPGNNYGGFVVKYDRLGNRLWNNSFGGGSFDAGNDVGLDSFGDVYVAGRFGSEAILIKYNSTSGEEIWNRSYIVSGKTTRFFGMDIDSSGDIYLVGDEYDSGGDWLVVKYNSSGDYQWNKTFDLGAGSDYAKDIALDSLGNIYLAAESNIDYYLVKLDNDGNHLWNVTNATSSRGYGVEVDYSDNVILT